MHTCTCISAFQTVFLVNPGPIAEVHLSIDTVTKKIRGYAFILFMMPEHAVRAYEELDGTIFMVRERRKCVGNVPELLLMQTNLGYSVLYIDC